MLLMNGKIIGKFSSCQDEPTVNIVIAVLVFSLLYSVP